MYDVYFFSFCFNSSGKVWKRSRSLAAKQVVPRRIGNFVEPLADIAGNFMEHLESLMDRSGTVADVAPEVNKWAFQGAHSIAIFI